MMLAEGFLRVLLYREERKFDAKLKGSQTCMQVTDASNFKLFNADATNRLTESAETGKVVFVLFLILQKAIWQNYKKVYFLLFSFHPRRIRR